MRRVPFFSTCHKSPSLAALVILALPAPVLAQEGAGQDQPGTSTDMEAARQSTIATWTPEKQAAYAAWPAETQDYYWSLTPDRQKLFWGLTDSDKVTLSSMSPEDAATAWERIESRPN